MSDFEFLCAKVAAGHGKVDRRLLLKAWDYAARAHDGHARRSSGAYFDHVVAVAGILADWRAPSEVVAIGLLHDVLKAGYANNAEPAALEAAFGPDISGTVVSTGMLGRFQGTLVARDLDAEVTDEGPIGPRMSVAAAELRRDPIAMVVKLADRQHNLVDLEYLDEGRRHKFLSAVVYIFVPFAERLGMRQVARQLDDRARLLQEPEVYPDLLAARQAKPADPTAKALQQELASSIEAAGLSAEVTWSPPSLRQIYAHNLERPAASQNLLDLFDLEVSVADGGACYRALGVAHRMWSPLQDLSDTLGRPMANGFRALRSRLRVNDQTTVQVCIASTTDWTINNHGITARWRGVGEELLPVIEPLPPRPAGHIMLLTPKGDVIYLPQGATALDFAYNIHSEIGHRYHRASVNGRPVEPGHVLADGDLVHIITVPTTAGPDPSWEQVVTTEKARLDIQRWHRRHRHQELVVEAWDRAGLVADVAELCALRSLSMTFFYADVQPDGKAVLRLGVTMVDDEELALLSHDIRQIALVLDVHRSDLPSSYPAIRRLTERSTRQGGSFGLAPASASTFVGRAMELERLLRALRNQNQDSAVLLWGQQRIGKTSVLLELERRYLGGDDLLTVFVDMTPQLGGETDFGTSHFLHLVAKKVEGKVRNENVRVAQFNRWKRAPLHYFRNFMDQVVRVIGAQTLLVIVDEFQTLGSLREEGASRDELFLALRSLVQHGAGVNFLFSGGGVLTELRRRSRIGNLLATVDAVPIGHLLHDEAEELLTHRPATVRFSRPAVDQMIALTSGHPYYLQLLGTRLDALDRPDIDVAQVEAARNSVITDRTQVPSTVEHYWLLGRKTDRGAMTRLGILAAIAGHRDAGVPSVEALADQPLPWPAMPVLAREVDALCAYGAVVDGPQGLQLPVPLVGHWLAANYPLERLRLEMKEKRRK